MKITYIKMLKEQKRKDDKLQKDKNGLDDKKEVKMKHLRAREKSPLTKCINKEKEIREGVSNSRTKNNILKSNVIKKNQVAMFALSLMLITAGYLNYTNKLKVATLGDAKLVSSQNILKTNENMETNTKEDLDNNAEDNSMKNIEVNSKADTNRGYFAETKLQREKMYSEMIETYTKILESSEIPSDQKDIASNEIKKINDRKSQIYTIENLLKTKGIENAVVLTNDDNIDIVVEAKENLEAEKVAQIQNIVSREMNAEIENIHITTKDI